MTTLFFIYKFIYFNWRLITLQYCIVFALHQHESTTGVHVLPWIFNYLKIKINLQLQQPTGCFMVQILGCCSQSVKDRVLSQNEPCGGLYLNPYYSNIFPHQKQIYNQNVILFALQFIQRRHKSLLCSSMNFEICTQLTNMQIKVQKNMSVILENFSIPLSNYQDFSDF